MARKVLLSKETLDHLCKLVDEPTDLVRKLVITVDIKGVAMIDVTRMIDPTVFNEVASGSITSE